MTDNMRIWNATKRPPTDALRTIKGGRLNGKTDISPQWRYQALTEHFGPCGDGWKYEIKRLWTEQGHDGQVFGFAEIALQVKYNGEWSAPIPGVGGDFMISKEKSGLYANDECFKMAVTDALGVAIKMLGVAADIYAGKWDGTKYKDGPAEVKTITSEQAEQIKALIQEVSADQAGFCKFFKVQKIEDLPIDSLSRATAMLENKRKQNA